MHRTGYIIKKIAAAAMALAMLLSAAGCADSGVALVDKMMDSLGVTVVAGEKLTGSQWINSDITGAVDENTPTSYKDDFHTAVNKEWLVNTPVEEGEEVDSFDEPMDVLQDQLNGIFLPGGEFYADERIMSQQQLDHMEELILVLMELAEDKDRRNELGVEPLRPYIEAIEEIDSIEALTAYMCNEGGNNFLLSGLVSCGVDKPVSSRDYYAVHIDSTDTGHLLMSDPYSYSYLSYTDYKELTEKQEGLKNVLGRLGYSDEEIKELFRTCFLFEAHIARDMPTTDETQSIDYLDQVDNRYTFEELEELADKFPLTRMIREWGLEGSDSFILYEPGFIRTLNRLYNEKNLEKFKAYYMVHTVLEAMLYLDEEAAAFVCEDEEADEETDPAEAEKAHAWDTACTYVYPNLGEVVQQVYIGRYCTGDMKENILAMVEEIRDYYTDMLNGTEWLSAETRKEAVKKLEKMQIHVMYPDDMKDYSGLSYDGYSEGGSLLEAVHTIRKFTAVPDADKVNRPVDRAEWDLNTIGTTDLNAFYMMTENSVYITAGIVAGDFIYDHDAPVEKNYARLGIVVGHEISHAFDTSGYIWDADGLNNKWWTPEDEVAFRVRADRLANHYSTLPYLPGGTNTVDGSILKGEAIADMGGMKCMLGLAAEIPGFDYAEFFRYFGGMFCSKRDMSAEMLRVSDEHPLDFLRTNVTVQQFDEFYEAFDVSPGDGMYLAPENRIAVW